MVLKVYLDVVTYCQLGNVRYGKDKTSKLVVGLLHYFSVTHTKLCLCDSQTENCMGCLHGEHIIDRDDGRGKPEV